MANTKISALTANTNPTWLEELVYAYNNANGKMTLNTMKAFVGWVGITTLNADANIWELSDGIYETTYDLYFKSWETVSKGSDAKQMLFVVQTSSGERGFLVYNWGHTSSIYSSYASYWYSLSSSVWECNNLADRAWSLRKYDPYTTSSINALGRDTIVQVVSNIDWSNELRPSSSTLPYAWVTYTIYVESVQSSYTVTLWTWITNPLWIALPSNSNKTCVITVLMTSTSTWIVTWCTIAS